MMQRDERTGVVGPFREFTFHTDALTGAVSFHHGLVVRCGACEQDLDPDSQIARDAVAFFLANRPAAKLARVVGRGLGMTGTKRPALGQERKDDR